MALILVPPFKLLSSTSIGPRLSTITNLSLLTSNLTLATNNVALQFGAGSTLTLSAGISLVLIQSTGTYNVTATQSGFSGQLWCQIAPIIKNDTSLTGSIGNLAFGFYYSPEYRADTNSTVIGNSQAFTDAINFSSANSGASTITSHTSFLSSITMASANNCSDVIGLQINDVSGSPTIIRQTGILINDLTKGSFKTPLHVVGTTGVSRHQPKIMFGADSDATLQVQVQTGALCTDIDTMTYASTITLDTTKPNVHKTTTVNATGNATINASSGGVAGQFIWIIIKCDATSNKTTSFGTHLANSGTLSCGGASKTAIISFVSDGTSFFECGRQNGM